MVIEKSDLPELIDLINDLERVKIRLEHVEAELENLQGQKNQIAESDSIFADLK